MIGVEPMVRVEVHDGVHVVRISRASRRNALTPELFNQLFAALPPPERVRALVLAGDGPVFCGGFDLNLCLDVPGTTAQLLRDLAAFIRRLLAREHPVVIAAHGGAIAGGCALLGAADIVVADAEARFGYPVVRLGFSPAVSAPYLLPMVHPGAGRTRLLDPGLIDGREALRLHLAHVLVETPEGVLPAALEAARTLAGKPSVAFGATKRLLHELSGAERSADAALDAALQTADTDENRALLSAAIKAQARPPQAPRPPRPAPAPAPSDVAGPACPLLGDPRVTSLAMLSVNQRVARLTIGRPERRHALSVDLLTALIGRVDELAALPPAEAPTVMVLSGAGAAFCAGMDLHEVLDHADRARQLLHLLAQFTHKLRALPCVSVAAVNGPAVGGGCGLVATCDLAVTYAENRIGFPEVDLGVCPAVVAPWLCRKIGHGRARRVLLQGGLMSGREAHALGLVDFLVPDAASLAPAVDQLVARLESGGPHALRTTKSLLNDLDGSADLALLRRAADISADVLATPQTQAALRAKLEI